MNNDELNTTTNEPHINKGVELLLRNRKKRRDAQQTPKSLRVTLDNSLTIFKREIRFHFDAFIDIKKK
jgi:hypothetical protein